MTGEFYTIIAKDDPEQGPGGPCSVPGSEHILQLDRRVIEMMAQVSPPLVEAFTCALKDFLEGWLSTNTYIFDYQPEEVTE